MNEEQQTMDELDSEALERDLNSSLKKLKSVAELVFIALASFTAIFFSMLSKETPYGNSLFLIVVCFSLFVLLEKLDSVAPVYAVIGLVVFWNTHSHLLQYTASHIDSGDIDNESEHQYGLGGTDGVIYSSILFIPVSIMSVLNMPPVLNPNRVRLLLILSVAVSIMPVKNANSISSDFIFTVLRCCMGLLLYTVMVMRYSFTNEHMHEKYGVVVILNMFHAFFCDFFVSNGIFFMQMSILLIVCYKKIKREKQEIVLKEPKEEGVAESDDNGKVIN